MIHINKVKEDFSYFIFKKNDWPIDIISYRNMLLTAVESKHVAFESDTTCVFFELSKQVEYENTILGIHRTSRIYDEYLRIQNMSHSPCLRAVRFVITKDNNIWSDNTHWTLAYIYKYGFETTLSDVPLYLVDLRKDNPVIYDCEGVVFDSLSDIKKALEAAMSIQRRLDLGWRPRNISYTIGQLYFDLEKVVGGEVTF